MNDTKLRERRLKAGTSEYSAVHKWVYKNVPDPSKCIHCEATDRPLAWANKSGQYLREVSDWLRLCYSCHGVYDNRKPACPKGHAYVASNSYFRPKGNRRDCMQCNRENNSRWLSEHREKKALYLKEYYQNVTKPKEQRANIKDILGGE